MRTYVLITTKPGKASELVTRIRKLKEVIWADWFYGRFDAIAILSANDEKFIDDFIHNVILKDPAVTHTETLISLHEDSIQEAYARERLKSLGVVE